MHAIQMGRIDMSEEVQPPVAAPELPKALSAFEDLHAGEFLTPESSYDVMRQNLMRVIVLAGEAESGKTTFLRAVYESFQRGPFAGYCFAGSRTLVGFEQRAFYGRIQSEEEKAKAPRTLLKDGQTFFHLQIADMDNFNSKHDLLFSDFSGEFFREAMDSDEACKSLGVVRRADHFVLFLDGEKIVQDTHRPGVITSSRKILRSFLENEMLGPSSIVDILLSKSDLLDGKGFETLVSKIENDFKQEFGSRVGRITFRYSSAHNRNKLQGVAESLGDWVKESLRYEQITSKMAIDPASLKNSPLNQWISTS